MLCIGHPYSPFSVLTLVLLMLLRHLLPLPDKSQHAKKATSSLKALKTIQENSACRAASRRHSAPSVLLLPQSSSPKRSTPRDQ